MVSVGHSRRRRADRRGEDSRRGEEAAASPTSRAQARATKPEAGPQASGKAREPRTPPEMGYGQASRSRVPQAGSGALRGGKVGTRGLRDPREGRRRRAARFLGGPLGEPPGAPPVSRQLQSMAPQAKRSPAMVHIAWIVEGEVGTAQGCAKRGVACLVRHWPKRVATEEPDEGNLHVRIWGEGAG
jgi:hypothetical protein